MIELRVNAETKDHNILEQILVDMERCHGNKQDAFGFNLVQALNSAADDDEE